MPSPPPAGRVLTLAEMESLAHRLRTAGQTLAWVNGCFDILHAGHLLLLETARAEADALVVGLNGDASVRALKGPDRPVHTARLRARMLAALRPVDYVVVFRGKRATSALRRIRPDVVVKGGDYSLETVDPGERAAVERAGGRFRFIGQLEGLSTSRILSRLNRERS